MGVMAPIGCRVAPHSKRATERPEPLTNANFGLLGVDFFESVNNTKRWKIQSEFAELHRSDNLLFLKTVTADFFAERTGNVVRTTSDNGRSMLDKNTVNLNGNVRIRAHSGYEFEMNSLQYNGEKHEFQSPDDVLMVGPSRKRPNMILRGRGLSADIDREHFFLKKMVVARKRFREEDWIHVRSSKGEFLTAKQRAVFVGNVDSTIPPGLAVRSDSMDLTSIDAREMMQARGNVVLNFKGKVCRAESASFEAGGDRVILEGNAQVESSDNEISGKRIVLYTVDDRVEVIQARGRIRN